MCMLNASYPQIRLFGLDIEECSLGKHVYAKRKLPPDKVIRARY